MAFMLWHARFDDFKCANNNFNVDKFTGFNKRLN